MPASEWFLTDEEQRVIFLALDHVIVMESFFSDEELTVATSLLEEFKDN